VQGVPPSPTWCPPRALTAGKCLGGARLLLFPLGHLSEDLPQGYQSDNDPPLPEMHSVELLLFSPVRLGLSSTTCSPPVSVLGSGTPFFLLAAAQWFLPVLNRRSSIMRPVRFAFFGQSIDLSFLPAALFFHLPPPALA